MFSNGDSSGSESCDASVYQRVLGDAFADLDPQLRTYFGPIPDGFVGVGVGRYAEAGLRVRALRPLFALLGLRRIAFAEHGVDVPFTVQNTRGPERSLNATRAFQFATGTREMTDSMRVIDGRLVDRIGIHGEIEIELAAHVRDGRLHLESRRLALRKLGVRWPLPPIVKVRLREEAESREGRLQHVDVQITAPILGQIYGYHGSFTYTLQPMPTSDRMWVNR